MEPGRRRWNRTRVLAWGAVVGSLAAPAGWFGTDVLERDNDFCNACHLAPGVPLHEEIRTHFDERPAVNLAGLHRDAVLPGRAAGEPFRCIDCHGGVGFVGKARTKWLAARDAFWYGIGHFDEPSGMDPPLPDEACAHCHASFREQSSEDGTAGGSPPFHALPVHNAALGVACVGCHVSHGTGGSEDLYYLHPVEVREQCAACHAEFE